MIQTTLTDDEVKRMYFNWLVHRVSLDDLDGRSYTHLAYLLHSMEFYWSNELDENREKDGLYLRHFWFDVVNEEADARDDPRMIFSFGALSGPCSVLEMLVALAVRIENDIMQEDDKGDRSPLWMYYMLFNLDLLGFDDDHIFDTTDSYVASIVRRMLDRKYDRDGHGSLFPLYARREDRREVDIWWQAQHWLTENFPD